MKWKDKNNEIIETDDINDILYLKNIINLMNKRGNGHNDEEVTGIGAYDGGNFYK